MGIITVDAAMATVLQSAEAGTEVFGPDGHPIVAIVPPAVFREFRQFLDDRRRLLEAERAEISLEELQAIDAAGGEIPHEEVIRRLGLA